MVKQCLRLLGSSFPAVAVFAIFKLCGQGAVDSQKLIKLCHMLIHQTLQITKDVVDKSKPSDEITNDCSATLQ